MLKETTEKKLPLLIRQKQHVCIEYEEVHSKSTKIVTQIIKADETGIIVESAAGSKVIVVPKIKNIAWKNIRFSNPKKYFAKEDDNFLNMQMDKINTEIIEKMKSLPEYYLSTRKARFTKNGSFIKKRSSQKEFEAEVFHWIKKRASHTEFCPLALLDNEVLLILYQKRFSLRKKDFKIIFDTDRNDINGIIQFILDRNMQIKDKRNNSLRGIAEDFL